MDAYSILRNDIRSKHLRYLAGLNLADIRNLKVEML